MGGTAGTEENSTQIVDTILAAACGVFPAYCAGARPHLLLLDSSCDLHGSLLARATCQMLSHDMEMLCTTVGLGSVALGCSATPDRCLLVSGDVSGDVVEGIVKCVFSERLGGKADPWEEIPTRSIDTKYLRGSDDIDDSKSQTFEYTSACL